MSIATRIETIEEHIENAYQHLIDLGVDLTNIPKNIDNISAMLETVYNDYSKVTGTGTEVTLANARKGKMVIEPNANTSQYTTDGRNIIDVANPSSKSSKTNVSVDGDILIVDTNNITSAPYAQYGEYDVQEGDVIRFGAILKNSNGKIAMQKYKTTWSNIKNITYTDGETFTSDSYTIASGETKFRILIYANDSVPETEGVSSRYEKVIVTKNNDNMNYEPYTNGASPNPSYPQEIKNVTGDNNVVIRGKNLINAPDVTISMANYIFNGAVSLEKGTYTIMVNAPEDSIYSLAQISVAVVAEDDTELYNQGMIFPAVINCAKKVKSIRMYAGGGAPRGTYKNFMIVKGSYTLETIPNYEPYITPIEKELNLGNLELCKIGDYQDIIFKNEPKNINYDKNLIENGWYKKGVIGKYIMPNNLGGYNSNNNWFYIGTDNFNNISTVNGASLICNNFTNIYIGLGKIGIYNTGKNIIVRNTDCTDLSSYRAYFTNNTTIFYTLLATPTYTQITETTLIEQLESLYRTIIPSGTIEVETESDEDNAQLIVSASALG